MYTNNCVLIRIFSTIKKESDFMKRKLISLLSAIVVGTSAFSTLANSVSAVTVLEPPINPTEETPQPTDYVIYESGSIVRLDSAPDITSYTVNQKGVPDLTGLKVSLIYLYGKDGQDIIYDNVSPLDYPEAFSVDTSEFDITKPGTYNIYISPLIYQGFYNGTTKFSVTVYEDVEKTLDGDANGDGEFNLADMSILKKWLLGKGELENWKNADLCEDGKINIFDFCVMRRYLLDEISPVSFTARNLTESVKSNAVTGAEADEDFIMSQTDFALSLLQNTADDKNTFISPYSVMQALAMTANGADNETKAEMEKTLGGISIDKLNEYLYTYRKNQPNSENCKLSTANSIWYRNGLNVLESFLQKDADYYDADAFSAPFDETTVNDINTWVKEKTDNMISRLLEEIEDDTVMYLINAVSFDAKWKTPYIDESQIQEMKFTANDNSVQQAEMMISTEYNYLEDENAAGFLKYYKDGRYAFAALLPNEGVSIEDYIAGLTPESLNNTLSNPIKTSVYTAIPKFSYDYDIDLADVLPEMGMPGAFDSNRADFSKMVEASNLYISKVIHKTHIDVFEEGTKAAAVTAVVMDENSMMIGKSVILNRPFVYCIVDTETSLPIFIGTLMSIPE